MAGRRPEDRLSAGQDRRWAECCKMADLVDDDPGKRERVVGRVCKDPAQKEQPRPRGHHHRAGHGEGRL